MNKVVMIGAAIAALVGGPALAADIPLKAPPAAAVVYNWTGFYGGIHGGYGWADTRWNGPATFFGVTAFDADSRGGIFGFHAGYNLQFSQFVLGVEAQYFVGNFQHRVAGVVPVFPQDRFATSIRDVAAVTGRAGFVWGNPWGGSSLIYAKGGWATTRIELDGISGPPVPNVQFEVRDRLNGWTVGGGWEWMLLPNLIVGVEYNHYRFNSETYNVLSFGAVNNLPLRIPLDDIRINTVTGRVSYKFSPFF